MEKRINQKETVRYARMLLFYRLAIALLLAIVVALCLLRPADTGSGGRQEVPPAKSAPATGAAAGRKPGLLIVDLASEVQEIARTESTRSDISTTYYSSPRATVHLHVIGYGQTCPLHIHRQTEEATVIVSGTPEVTQICAQGKKPVRSDKSYGPGTLIYSPPYCGHRWRNRDPRAMEANLVFASPPFDGNFYLDEDDPRLAEGGMPEVRPPDDGLRAFLAKGAPYQLGGLSLMKGKLRDLFVRDKMSLDARPGPALLYLTRGQGALIADRPYPIRQQQLLLIPADTACRIEAQAGSPIAAVIFTPEG